jgi:hypothetical protein
MVYKRNNYIITYYYGPSNILIFLVKSSLKFLSTFTEDDIHSQALKVCLEKLIVLFEVFVKF